MKTRFKMKVLSLLLSYFHNLSLKLNFSIFSGAVWIQTLLLSISSGFSSFTHQRKRVLNLLRVWYGIY